MLKSCYLFKKYFFLLLTYVLVFSGICCKYIAGTEENEIVFTEDIRIINLNGLSKIIFKQAKFSGYSYVLASYEVSRERIRQTKSNVADTLMVDGFERPGEHIVTLMAMSGNGELSEPLTIKVHPLIPNFLLAGSTIDLTSDYGGVHVSGINKNRTSLLLHVIGYDDVNGVYIEKEVSPVNSYLIDHYVGGFSPVNQTIGAYLTDGFGNHSDTLLRIIKPMIEVAIDKSRFYTYKLANDSRIGFGWDFKYFFDGNTGEPGWHTDSNLADKLMIGTMGLGRPCMISRLVLYNRTPDTFRYQNPKKFTIWASRNKVPKEYRNWPESVTEEGTVLGDWINVGNFVYPAPPSGLLPDQANNDDREFGSNGVSFRINNKISGIRFLRFQCTQTWGMLGYVNAKEITLYGPENDK